MNKYSLKVLYPSSNKYETKQYYTVIVEAHSVKILNDSYQFWKRNQDGNLTILISSYPITYTIIEKIE